VSSDDLRPLIGRTIRQTRLALKLTQAQIGEAVGLSQTEISAIERAIYPALPLATAVRVLEALDIRVELRLVPPYVAGRGESSDEAHARCVGYVARRLEQAGWQVAREVPVGGSRWRGFIDVLAFHPGARVLLIIEVKTEIADVGEIDRQMSSYERDAWSAAHGLGWRPATALGALVLLATEANDASVRRHRDVFGGAYSIDGRALGRLVRSPAVSLPQNPARRGQRAIAMIDPRSRRLDWLMPTTLDGRRSPAHYRDRRDFVRASRGTSAASRSRSGSRRAAA